VALIWAYEDLSIPLQAIDPIEHPALPSDFPSFFN